MKGDATCPVAKGLKLMPHIVNDSGKWGKGYVMALSKRWPKTREAYLNWWRWSNDYENDFHLGSVLFQSVNPSHVIAHMIAQRGIVGRSNPKPIRYESLRECLQKVALWAKENKKLNVSVHMPMIGCGLAGGSFTIIGPMIEEELDGIPVTIYTM